VLNEEEFLALIHSMGVLNEETEDAELLLHQIDPYNN
jgi:hypothetical protein